MVDFRTLMRKAKDATISDREVDAVAEVLRSREQSDQLYRQVYILGRSFARRYENLIADYLVYPDEPEVSAIALSVLCAHWKLGRKYRGYLLAGMSGLSWDVDDDIRVHALSSAGAYLRENSDREVLAELVGIAETDGVRLIRAFAWEAVARALGDSHDETRTHRDPEKNAEWVATLRQRVASRLGAEPAWDE